MNFYTGKLNIASLFNFDRNSHVDVVCIKLKWTISVNLVQKWNVTGEKV